MSKIVSSSAFVLELSLLRAVHAAVRARAASAWTDIEALAKLEMVAPRAWVSSTLANAIFDNPRYDASERFESVEEFQTELTESLDSTWPVRKSPEDVKCYVLTPFFPADSDSGSYRMHLGVGYLSGYVKLDELRVLDVELLSPVNGIPDNLLAEEADALLAYHRSSTVHLINALRRVRTALYYIETALEKSLPTELAFDVEYARKTVAALRAKCTLAHFPPVARHFGSEADRVNSLKSLDLPLAVREFGIA